MIVKQVELKKAEIKALASLDKSMRLTFDVNLSGDINIDGIHALLYKPLVLEIREDVEYNSA